MATENPSARKFPFSFSDIWPPVAIYNRIYELIFGRDARKLKPNARGRTNAVLSPMPFDYIEDEMVDLAYGLIAFWILGMILLVVRALNFIRLMFNNLAPSDSYGDTSQRGDLDIFNSWYKFYYRRPVLTVDPAYLTDVGRQYQKKAVINKQILYTWVLVGFVLIAAFFSYIKASGVDT